MRVSLLLFVFLISSTLFAQRGKRDVVYLKNGSIVRGTIVLQDPNKMIKLKTADNSLWVFTNEQIDSIKRTDIVRNPPKTGYFNLTEMGVLAGNYSNATKAPFTLINVSSWYFEEGFSTGLGVGIEFSNETYLPVVADFRYYIRDKRPLPFISLQAGYSIALGGSYEQTFYAVDDIRMSPINFAGPMPSSSGPIAAKGGLLINPAIGIQTPLNDNLALTFSAGYRWMKHRYIRSSDSYTLDIDYNRLSLKVGLLFK